MRNFKALTLCIFLAASLHPSLFAKSIKLRGYITSIKSPTEYEIDDYRITRDVSLVLEFEKSDDPEEQTSFRPEEIRVGTEVEIRGDYDEATHELKAKAIKVHLDEHQRVKRTALLETTPELQRTGKVWSGRVRVDGQSVLIQEDTLVTIKLNNTQKRAAKESVREAKKKTANQKPGDTAVAAEESGDALKDVNQIHPNSFVTYEGRRQKDGSVLARKVEFIANELDSGEAKLWKRLTPKVKDPAYLSGRPGELRIADVGKFKLTPSAEVQKYVQDLGTAIIPRMQRDLPAGDSQKIPFRFFVVDAKQPNAFALPNGTIVIHSAMLTLLENEAQLAAIIGHEIAHATQEHSYRQSQYHKKALMALRIGAAIGAAYGGRAVSDLAKLTEAAIRNGYSRSLENQADRVGTEYMMAAGYDPREAPRGWKVIALKRGDQPTNFFWSTHDNHTTRRSYLMAELRNNYSDIDFTSYRRDDVRFATVVQALNGLNQQKGKKLKVKY